MMIGKSFKSTYYFITETAFITGKVRLNRDSLYFNHRRTPNGELI